MSCSQYIPYDRERSIQVWLYAYTKTSLVLDSNNYFIKHYPAYYYLVTKAYTNIEIPEYASEEAKGMLMGIVIEAAEKQMNIV